MELKEYSIPEDIKKKLGLIVREIRKARLENSKNVTLIENNPYTKENFCDNNTICHYHTLTKLENELIKEEIIYHILLQKLGFYYQVPLEEHKKNMNNLESHIKQVLYAGEYIDDELAKKMKIELEKYEFHKDIIADFHKKLLLLFIHLQLTGKCEYNLEMMEQFIDFFDGIYKGIAYHCIGIVELHKFHTERAQDYFLRTKDVYDEHKISKGLISPYLIGVYVFTNNYYESVPLCNEMEKYYEKTENYKRLMHVYNYLSDYYFLINALDVAKQYFNQALEIIERDKTLERFKHTIYYNWGIRCFKDYRYEEALDNFITSLELCNRVQNKLQIIVYILIIMTKLNYPIDEINKYYSEGERFFQYSNEGNQVFFKYFRFKLKKSKYYRKYAVEKVLPRLAENPRKSEILLFFYQDLYK